MNNDTNLCYINVDNSVNRIVQLAVSLSNGSCQKLHLVPTISNIYSHTDHSTLSSALLSLFYSFAKEILLLSLSSGSIEETFPNSHSTLDVLIENGSWFPQPYHQDSLHPEFVDLSRNGIIIFIYLFILLVVTVKFVSTYLQSQKPLAELVEPLLVYTDSAERRAYFLSHSMCMMSLAVSLAAAFLLPFSIVSQEFVYRGVSHNYYLQWLTGSLIHDLWNFVTLAVNVVIFFLLPFSYFLLEAEGFATCRHRSRFNTTNFTARLSEAFFSLLLTLSAVFGLSYTGQTYYSLWFMQQGYGGNIVYRERPSTVTNDGMTTESIPFHASLWNVRMVYEQIVTLMDTHLTLIHTFLAVFGLMLLLCSSPVGLGWIIHTLIQKIRLSWPPAQQIHPSEADDVDELIEMLQLELHAIERRFSIQSTQAKHSHESFFISLSGTSLQLQQRHERVKEQLSALEDWHVERSRHPFRRVLRKWGSLLLYLGMLLLLLTLCSLALFYILVNLIAIVTGWGDKRPPADIAKESFASLSYMGNFGALLQMILVSFYLLVSLVGLYRLPIIRSLVPTPGATTLSTLMGNCASLLLISEALPLQVRILGITAFQPLACFVRVDWFVSGGSARDRLFLFYIMIYLALHGVYTFQRLREPLYEVWREAVLPLIHLFLSYCLPEAKSPALPVFCPHQIYRSHRQVVSSASVSSNCLTEEDVNSL